MRFILILLALTSCASNAEFGKLPDTLTTQKSTGFLKINPYGNAPLSAELHITPPQGDLIERENL